MTQSGGDSSSPTATSSSPPYSKADALLAELSRCLQLIDAPSPLAKTSACEAPPKSSCSNGSGGNATRNLVSLLSSAVDRLVQRWRQRDAQSELALQGLLLILEACLSQCTQLYDVFDRLITALGYHSVAFWKLAVPMVYDSDLSTGTRYRDALLFALALYDVNHSKNRLRELYAAVPGVRQSMLGVHAKRFGEKYRHIQMVRSRAASRIASVEDLSSAAASRSEDDSFTTTDCATSSAGGSNDSARGCSLLTLDSLSIDNGLHHKQRVINVSNAPPVSVKRKHSGSWEIKQGSGGLVACVDPVMSADRDNVWLANLGINLSEQDLSHLGGDDSATDSVPPSTNSIGLPLIRQARAGEIFHVLEDAETKADMSKDQRDVEREMSLLGVLNNYNQSHYQLNPVIVSAEDYAAYYGGISNGLLWPALHNLPQYIVKDYDQPEVLREHWCSYVRVNYQFAVNAARNSRPQDFIWIHDYHLMLTGQIMRSLDSNLEIGFFLHIPFQPPESFMTKYRAVGEPILRAILRFNKVGFQTERDRAMFVKIVRENVPRARIQYEQTVDIYAVSHENWTCSLGVFPVSIKNEDFLAIAQSAETIIMAQDIRKELKKSCAPDGKIFFSVERFDYTKGVAEKLKAFELYLQRHPERIGKDQLFQIAVTNRRSVESYRQYQDECIALTDRINATFKSEAYPDWKPVRLEMEGLPRARLIAHYLAMDVGVVTPAKDGMNLVAKEMMICNPRAGLMLSTGAGAEVQLGSAGLYADYIRVEEIGDTSAFADAFHAAVVQSVEEREAHGARLHSFLQSHDIDEWSRAFLDPTWTHEVIRPIELMHLADFYTLMGKTAQVRRQIVEVVLKGMPVRPHYVLSLENAKTSLERSCYSGKSTLMLATGSRTGSGNSSSSDEGAHESLLASSSAFARLDVANELVELKRDLAFLHFIQQDDIGNVEHFLETLAELAPTTTPFHTEVERAAALLSMADHFHFFFTDRDGTLKSYACSYPSSVQPAYSAVIQAQFARRCAQFCAIVTTAPLVHLGILDVSTMPEGYYAYGASAGREWYFNPAMQFKDDSIAEADLALLDRVFEKIEDLLDSPGMRLFAWCGSGLQKHYGHITVARQDVYGSVPAKKSEQLCEAVHRIVAEVDPEGAVLAAKVKDLDVKVFTKARLSGRIFNKGHGVRLVERKMGLRLNDGNVLVCGDSESDLPMLEECLVCAPHQVYSIWVIRDQNADLKEKVTALMARFGNSQVAFVSSPEALLGAMAQATVRELHLRPPGFDDDDL